MDTAKKVANRFKLADSDMSLQQAYKFLELPTSASMDEVNDKFKKLMLKWHPDRNQGDPAAAEMAKMLGKAYRIIKERKEGTPRPEGRPARPRDDGNIPEPVLHSRPWSEAAKDLPSATSWRIQAPLYGGTKKEFNEQYGFAVGGIYARVVIGQSQSHWVFVLVEHAAGQNFRGGVKVDMWQVARVVQYPISQDISKLAPKALKAMCGENVWAQNAYTAPKKFYVLNGDNRLTEQEMTKGTAGNGLSLKDALIGANFVSGASSDRLPMIEVEGKMNDAKRRANPNMKYNVDSWIWYDFTVYINGKGFTLNEKSCFNLFSMQSTNKDAKLFKYVFDSYEWGQRKNLTKLKGGTMKLPAIDALRCLESGLEGESGELTVGILKAMEMLDPSNKKTAAKLAALGVSIEYGR